MKKIIWFQVFLLYFIASRHQYIYAQCVDNVTYRPNNNTPVKFVKLNIHFVRNANGDNFFSDADGLIAAKKIIETANQRLTNMPLINYKVNGTQITTLPSKYRYVIFPLLNDLNDPEHDGIYFHNSASYNTYDQMAESITQMNNVYSLFGSGNTDNVYDVFIGLYAGGKTAGTAPTHPTRFCFLSTTHTSTSNVVDWTPEARTLNHEMGHVMGLAHAWYNDCCDDTPVHDQVDTLSNNVMDYNKSMNALTPSQLGIIHTTINNFSSSTSNYYSCPSESYLTYLFSGIINGDITGEKIVNSMGPSSSINFQQNNVITFKAMKSVKFIPGFSAKPTAAGNKFIAKIENLCTLITLNTNEDTWDDSYKTMFGIKNPTSARLDGITTLFPDLTPLSCGSEDDPNARLENSFPSTLRSKSIKIYPNPNDGTFTINFPNSEASYEVQIVDLLGNVVLKENVSNTSTKNYSLNNLSNGMYIVNLTGDGVQKRTKVQVIR